MVKVSSAPTRSTSHGRSIGNEIGDIIRTLSQAIGKKAVAAIVQKDVRTVERWLAAKSASVGAETERILRDTFQIYRVLSDAGDSDYTIRAWFLGMNPLLNDHSPIELLIEGRARAVIAAARSFADA